MSIVVNFYFYVGVFEGGIFLFVIVVYGVRYVGDGGGWWVLLVWGKGGGNGWVVWGEDVFFLLGGMFF